MTDSLDEMSKIFEEKYRALVEAQKTHGAPLAAHEAAHAVVCECLGIAVEYCSISPEPYTKLVHGQEYAEENLVDNLIFITAGFVIGCMRGEKDAETTASKDFEEIEKCLLSVDSTPDNKQKLVRVTGHAARELINENMKAFAELTRSLIKKKRIEGAEIREIFQRNRA